jgi:hypothetical protein
VVSLALKGAALLPQALRSVAKVEARLRGARLWPAAVSFQELP